MTPKEPDNFAKQLKVFHSICARVRNEAKGDKPGSIRLSS